MSLLHPFLVLVADWWVKMVVFSNISQLKMPRIKVFLISLAIAMFHLISLDWTRFLDPFYLILVTVLFLKPAWKVSQYLFYGMLPFVLTELFQRLTNIYEGVQMVIVDGEKAWLLTLVSVLSILAFLPIGYLASKIFRFDFVTFMTIFQHRIGKKAGLFINLALAFYGLILYPLMLSNREEQNFTIVFQTKNSTSELNLFLTYIYVFGALLIYLNYKAKEYQDQELQRSKDQQLSALKSYSEHIEGLYRELRSFRHDYTNVLTSLNEAFEQEDLPAAREIYQAVLAQSDKRFYDNKYDIANLANLTNSAMKSIISAKLMEASSKGIHLTIEIPEPIGDPDMDLLDVVTLLSILLDNAIEASQLAEQKSLGFAYFAEGDKTVLILENSTVEERVNAKTIYQYGQSSKGDGRGIGLANVKDILAKYHHINLQTDSRGHHFTQTLIF
ncbi:sensor histidine kinase [Streptococcus merionis]|uniref:Two-component system, AgrA family, sensor histidine kinase n=1 Tax=Streptococcus merionis TaxID=400065 RepID=A0A239SWH1_9STRE|nr:sensor histidine kinase [Streptococcus merionis]SNU89582.1 two-component system, AgrA family, sensor histidine kinase [Streptococcus merionis]